MEVPGDAEVLETLEPINCCTIDLKKKKKEPEVGVEEEKSEEEEKEEEPAAFECNICFDAPSQPVVTSCGHLYCWPCIYRWLNSGRSVTSCPVCKADTSEATIIPIYGRGGNQKDPRKKKPIPEDLPPRPTPQRTETPQRAPHPFAPFFQNAGHYQRGGFTFTAGIGPGLFPFQMNVGGNGNRPLTPQQQRENQQSRAFMLVAFLIFVLTIFMS